MVKMEPQFIATKYPGYFFNSDDGQLYSMKVDGILKPLKFHKPNHFNHLNRWSHKTGPTRGGYQVSVKGQKRWLLIEYLESLEQHDATIPVKENSND